MRIFLIFLVLTAIALDAGAAVPGTPKSEPLMEALSSPHYPDLNPVKTTGAYRSAAAETTFLAYWQFDQSGLACETQGWISVDRTAQVGDFFHVDDFAGLGGGDFGRLSPLEGSQSMWCGARPQATGPVCGYATLPGYGNDWNQTICTVSCLPVDSTVAVNYLISWDTEPGYDWVKLEFDTCDGSWQSIIQGGTGGYASDQLLDGTGGPVFRSDVVPDSLHSGTISLRFHFHSDPAWSDQDGKWDTDGAFIVDSLSVTDNNGTVLAVEDFEDEVIGAGESDDWQSCTESGYGDFAALYPGIELVQEDPCVSDLSCQWAFLKGSTETYACGGFPAQTAVPRGNARGQYIWNEVWSPAFPWTGVGATAELTFDAYKDLPLDNLIFFVFHVRSIIDNCPGDWKDFGFVYYGGTGQWTKQMFPIGTFVEPGATELQVALGVRDMCGVWCGINGTGACHSHAPLFDNVSVYRINTQGPVWSNRDVSMFQDNFATDGTLTGTVRADMADNTNNWGSSHNIIPGDSMVVEVAEPDFGLKLDPYTGTRSAVYTYVSVWPQNQPGKTGSNLTDDDVRWPVVDSLTYAGATWYLIRCDSVLTAQNYYSPVSRFAIDLNDNLFTPGDTVCFFFRADSDGPSSDVTYWTRSTGTTNDLYRALSNPMEFTCLPAGGYLRGGDILYVDQYDGYGGQQYFDTAFQMLGIEGMVDRYDTRGPTSFRGNSLGGRIKHVQNQLTSVYRKVIWDAGQLTRGTIGDGSSRPSYADDGAVLYEFLENLQDAGGIYFTGDNLPADLLTLDGGAYQMRNKYVGYSLTSDDHHAAGLGVSPLVVATPGSMFDHAFGPDSLVAFGGCPTKNAFDVMLATGTSTGHARYNGSGSETHAAVVAQSTTNPKGSDVGLVLSGFSYASIRDNRAGATPARIEHLRDILSWLGNVLPTPTAASATIYTNSLAQNYPNPFNPTTTISFTVKQSAPVSLRVYNVAGQLVRTLVNDTKVPGVSHRITWDGRNDNGSHVSSGVYFYKLATTDFVRTRKMVLLK